MQINTKAFGYLEIDEKQKVKIPRGLFGFENYTEYALIFDTEHEPFCWLQSVEEIEIAFILIDPFLFRKDYEANVSDEELSEIGINTHDDKILTFSIVTIPQDGSPMTANLQGPIIINKNTMTGMQAVLSDLKWKTKHDILAEMSNTSKEGQ